MANAGQHRTFHAGIRDFLIEMGIEPSRKNVEEAKAIFKKYLNIHSVASLTDKDYTKAISATFMIMAREFGKELPSHQAEKTMSELLKEINYD